jgi:hypothetical protein
MHSPLPLELRFEQSKQTTHSQVDANGAENLIRRQEMSSSPSSTKDMYRKKSPYSAECRVASELAKKVSVMPRLITAHRKGGALLVIAP